MKHTIRDDIHDALVPIVLTVAVVLIVAVCLVLASVAKAAPEISEPLRRPCYREAPWSHGDTKAIARCLEKKIPGVPGGWDRARQIGSCESGWYHAAQGDGYAGTWQTTRREMKNWPLPGAPHWVRALLEQHPNWRSSASRNNPYRQTIVVYSHVSGPEGWSYIGECDE